MDIAPNGTVHPFDSIDASTLPGQCPGGVGLTSALVVLGAGWVIVGSLPTSDGTAGACAGNGSIVQGGTVVRLNTVQSPSAMPTVQSMTPIGNGFAERTDPAALVIGPTGVALAADGSLHVADTLNDRTVTFLR